MNEEAVKAVRAEYYRNWRKRNPDKVREINARYWERRAERLAASENPEEAGKIGQAVEALADEREV